MATATNWGNYHGYHGSARHFPGSSPSASVRDPRLTLLESLIPGLFKAKSCLDVGCNTGAVSCQLAFDFDAASVTGVDIDPKLVSEAEDLVALRSSCIRPRTDEADQIVDYFPTSAVLKYGYRFPPSPALSKWPRVRFISSDWVVLANPATAGPYDVILALSVIKWLHLEHLDEGLVRFFRKCSSSLVSGGYLVLEMHPWESYVTAVEVKKAPHFKEHLEKLKYRPETSFNGLLQEQGLKLCATSDDLPRRISVYRRD
ncbi:S-adenosyl-L-methionine-dependent methyltransferase [Lindgomyces ingoldianus]|uniref:S-adenosyl-L-methionine-dependent methyltransferase n=1 Tax=Lindgomyces ingoldianus TaxID=673940 RepID=A0ACB6QH96_9PLEO|nr:S-adenosyl-L-methionine-dependent methyltransferase [Lindgomyces ingoldianus]KAF2465732.1 S-adenosyl-L-methionine-dependent methyltransferase [Lindgomyces ingoldianus]